MHSPVPDSTRSADSPPPTRKPRRRTIFCVAAVAAAALVPGADTAIAGPTDDRDELPITMQVQEKDQWCWAAAGNTIADFHGQGVTQTEFCQLAHDESGSDCANNQGYLQEVAWALEQIGFSSPGRTLDYAIPFTDVQSQITARQPIETRIGWTSGGGHMHVIYGTGDGTVSWGDPWPSTQRYSTATYDEYTSNSEFQWTHTLAEIRK